MYACFMNCRELVCLILFGAVASCKRTVLEKIERVAEDADRATYPLGPVRVRRNR